jgi:hypothetical protein
VADCLTDLTGGVCTKLKIDEGDGLVSAKTGTCAHVVCVHVWAWVSGGVCMNRVDQNHA